MKIKSLTLIPLLFGGLLSHAQEAPEPVVGPVKEPVNTGPLSTTGTKLDGIAAIVNEGVVLQSQLDSQLQLINERARREGLRLPPADVLQEQILEQLIVEQIQLQRADRVGLQISDQMLNTTLASIAAENGVTFAELPEVLARDGIDYAAYRRDVRMQMTLQQLRQIDVVGRISVAPREIEMCIADLEGNVVGNSDYRLSHILISVPDSATAADFAAAKEKADEVYQQLVDGESFATAAIEHSDSQQTRLQGGDLGWRKGDELPTLFADVVGSMQQGDFSEPIRAVSGYHLVYVQDLRGANQKSEIDQVRVRHVLVSPNEIIDDATARQKVTEARDDILAGADFAETAKLVSDDPGSANTGGEMDWAGPGSFVPEFERMANTLEIGELSEPFRTQFGWHILEVLDRRTYDNTEEVKEMSCVERVRNSKLTDETELWVRRIRDEAYVKKNI